MRTLLALLMLSGVTVATAAELTLEQSMVIERYLQKGYNVQYLQFRYGYVDLVMYDYEESTANRLCKDEYVKSVSVVKLEEYLKANRNFMQASADWYFDCSRQKAAQD